MTRKITLSLAFSALSLSYAWTLLTFLAPEAIFSGNHLRAYVFPTIRTQQPTPDDPWITITEAEIMSGAIVPQHTNVIFHVPFEIGKITRTVLLGHSGNHTRYWGYCFPDHDDPDEVKPGQLPGKVFLSEAERKWRAARVSAQKPVYSVYSPPTKSALRHAAQIVIPTIRHQVELFRGGQTCYIMTDAILPIGIDLDLDELNQQEEKKFRTDPRKPDTDGDGLGDAMEALSLGTNALLRDTDQDGIIDGIEDRNRNGIHDIGETDPLKRDSDNDGLCDGYCRVTSTMRICGDNMGRECLNLPYARWLGEDRNLNGIIETKLGETDPLKVDTDGDGILDDQEYYNCLLKGDKSC